MSGKTRISVIVPVFEDPDGIRACLEGLARQTVPVDQFDVVVVDNGSNPPIVLPVSPLLQLSLIQCGRPGSYAAKKRGRACGQRCVPGLH